MHSIGTIERSRNRKIERERKIREVKSVNSIHYFFLIVIAFPIFVVNKIIQNFYVSTYKYTKC